MRDKFTLVSILAIILIVGTVFCIPGCVTGSTNVNPTATAKPVGEKVIRIGEMWDITNVDPAVDGTMIGEKAAVTETLVAANPDFTLKPALAKSWKQVDANTWEFTLRDDVVFHDGTKMTASAVKFSIDRDISMDARTKSMLKLKSVEVVNDNTVRFITNEENPILPGVLHYPNTAIMSPASADSSGKLIKPIGTGPYKFESYDLQTHTLTVVKNDNYWGGAVGADKLILKGIPDPNTRAMAIENGELDFTVDVPYSETDRIDQLPGVVVEKYATPRVYKIDCNLKRASLEDVRVRQAISYAIDRDSIVENVLYNVGKPAAGPFLPAMTWSNKDLKPYDRNVEKAKQLLTDAGWVDANGDGIREKDGQQLKLVLMTYPARPGLPPMSEAIAAELKDIGVSVQTLVIDNSACTEKIKAGDWDLYLAAYNIAMVPDPAYVLTNWYTTTGPDNNAKYSNPKVDALVNEGSTIKDMNERYKKFNEVEAIVYDEQPIIIVAYYGCAVVKKDYVKGFVFDPTAHDYRINAGMSIEK